MPRRPDPTNVINFAVRSKEYITEELALRAILEILQQGRHSGDVPMYGLYVQNQVTRTERVYYIREIRPQAAKFSEL